LIIGRGLLGTSLSELRHENVFMFASGVSNSKESNESEFERERNLLQESIDNSAKNYFFYFSTCSISDPSLVESPYTLHKRKMEGIVLSKSNGRVIRLPNIVGPAGNPTNLLNHLKHSIVNEYPLEIQINASRYLLGVDEMNVLVQSVVDHGGHQTLLSLAPPKNIKVTSIVSILESSLGKKAKLELVEGGASYKIDFEDTANYASKTGFEFGTMYYENLLEKWSKIED